MPEATDPAAAATGAPAAPAAQAPAAATPPAGAPEGASGTEDSAATIARLENELKAARQEAGKSRINAKQNAADEARQELAQQIGKAIGLVSDDPPDPAKLTEQLTAQTTAAKQAETALAVYKSAATAGGDPAALLDSRSFLEKVATLDPSDNAALDAAIKEAVAVNPRLGVQAPVTPGMKPNPAQGRSASPPLGIGEQIAAAAAAGDTKAVIRLKASQLLTN